MEGTVAKGIMSNLLTSSQTTITPSHPCFLNCIQYIMCCWEWIWDVYRYGWGVQRAHVLGLFFNEKDSIISLWDCENVSFLFSLVYSHSTSSSNQRDFSTYPFLHLLRDKSLPDFTFPLSVDPKKWFLWASHFHSSFYAHPGIGPRQVILLDTWQKPVLNHSRATTVYCGQHKLPTLPMVQCMFYKAPFHKSFNRHYLLDAQLP